MVDWPLLLLLVVETVTAAGSGRWLRYLDKLPGQQIMLCLVLHTTPRARAQRQYYCQLFPLAESAARIVCVSVEAGEKLNNKFLRKTPSFGDEIFNKKVKYPLQIFDLEDNICTKMHNQRCA
jgi:hypothetical protein